MNGNGETVLVTGASGFLGRYCSEALRAAGFNVRGLVRDPDRVTAGASQRGGVYRCNLPDHIDQAAFEGPIRAVVHCAYDTRFTTAEQCFRTNVEGTKALLDLSRRASVGQFVFISSLASHAAAVSLYGRTKFQLERLVDLTRDTIIKPGTIIGPGGLFERTRAMMRAAPVLPVFYGDRRIQTVWVEDVSSAVVQSVLKSAHGSYVVAAPAVPLKEFYLGVASLDGCKPLLVPFPGDLALALVRLVEKAGVRLPISSENLAGLKCLKVFDSQADLDTLGVSARSFQSSLRALATLEKEPPGIRP